MPDGTTFEDYDAANPMDIKFKTSDFCPPELLKFTFIYFFLY